MNQSTIFALSLALSVANYFIEPVFSEDRQLQLNPRIKAVMQDKLREGAGKTWPNPKITITDDMVSVSSGKQHAQFKDKQMGEMEKFLVSLPVSAWPYGRVVEVSELGISSGGPQGKDFRKRSWVLIRAVMKRLDVTVQLGPPSA